MIKNMSKVRIGSKAVITQIRSVAENKLRTVYKRKNGTGCFISEKTYEKLPEAVQKLYELQRFTDDGFYWEDVPLE